MAAWDFFWVELLVLGKLVRCMLFFAIDVATRKVEILGLHAQLTGPWMEPVELPPRSHNLNSHAERFVRSIKEECLDHLILFSEEQLQYVLTEYLKYYHHERIHLPLLPRHLSSRLQR